MLQPDRIVPPVAHAYPLMLDVSDRQIVIIGGGAVAARKAAGLLVAGVKQVRVIAPAFRGTFGPEVIRITKQYDISDLADADLVFAATNSTAVNDRVVHDAKTRRIWVNRADDSDLAAGDFVTPAKFQNGPITVTVSAGSAALSTLVRDELEKRFDPGWTMMAIAMQTLRPEIKANIAEEPRRRDVFRALATVDAIRILQQEGIDGIRKWIFKLP